MEISIIHVCEQIRLVKLVFTEMSESRFSSVVHKLKLIGALICIDPTS
jgi:hypothetical protein